MNCSGSLRAPRPRAASVALDELGQAVLGEEVVDGLAEQRLEGGVAVGSEALELAVDRRGELAGHACLARACGCRGRAAAGRSARRAPGVPGADDDLHNPLRPHFDLQGLTAHLTEAVTSGKFPPMKAVRADIKRRVVIPGAKPGDIFDVQRQSDERFVLVRLHRANEAPGMSREACLEAMDRSPLNVDLSWAELRRITREP